jgi:putative heme-binding domain-containing protein
VLSALLSGPQHIPGLLTAVEKGVVPRVAIDSLRKKQLTQHKDAAIRERANKLFSLEAAGNRAKVYEDMKSVVSLAPHADNGRAVFKKVCANCHRLDREGFPVGPDLFGIRNQPKEAILLHILIPEQEITPGFVAYVLTTKEGRVLTGLVASETPTSVTLKQPQGKEETILRSDIEELAASKLSLMPQNLETQLSRQEFADLLAYLKGEK